MLIYIYLLPAAVTLSKHYHQTMNKRTELQGATTPPEAKKRMPTEANELASADKDESKGNESEGNDEASSESEDDDDELNAEDANDALSCIFDHMPLCRNCLRDRDGAEPCRCIVCYRCSRKRVETEFGESQAEMIKNRAPYFTALKSYYGSHGSCHCEERPGDEELYSADA